MSDIRLCALAEVADPGSRGFDLPQGEDEQPLRLFLVRKGDVLRAYRNSCPHTRAPLEWLPDQFLAPDDGFIQCALHGALFDIPTGRCLRGPCIGDHLESLPITVRDGVVYLQGQESA